MSAQSYASPSTCHASETTCQPLNLLEEYYDDDTSDYLALCSHSTTTATSELTTKTEPPLNHAHIRYIASFTGGFPPFIYYAHYTHTPTFILAAFDAYDIFEHHATRGHPSNLLRIHGGDRSYGPLRGPVLLP